MPTLRYYGHSAFRIQDDRFTVYIDPFLSGNPHCQALPALVEVRKCDFILVTHSHADHFGDTLELAGKFGATVVATHELAVWCEAQGVKAHGMGVGGSHEFPFGKVKLVPAIHGMGGGEGGKEPPPSTPVGLLVTWGKAKTLYHAGDTAFFSDMKLLSDRQALDVACLPIGGNYTMGVEDAVRAAEVLDASLFIPMHYNTWPVIEADALAFQFHVEKMGKKCRLMKAGEKIEY
jgi:L-ascorbate metabolism protein UlaG (beta-lactamase superfamily)